MPDLLLELFSEEIPARMQAKAAEDLRKLVTSRLVDAGLVYEGANSFATPRRLTLTVHGIPAKQPDVKEEKKGPRVGAPENAIAGFLKGAGLSSISEAKVQPDKKGDFYIAVIDKPGRPAIDVIKDVLHATIATFPWPKSMRWGARSATPGSLSWVRPLHSIVATFGPETEEPVVVPLDIGGIQAGNTTRGHRFMAPAAITVRRFDDYVASLEKAKVVLDPARRADTIRADAKNLAFAQGYELVEDEGLLAEVAGLVEWPVTLMGSFDPAFLNIPGEVIRATIRNNQKCFVLRDPATARLTNKFILVANIEASDHGKAIVAGNERVIRARLADAKFFYDADLKTKLEDRLPKFEQIVFHEKLGTQAERIARIVALAGQLAPLVGADPAKAERAAQLCKADLLTEVVGEFPELQGLMGKYYAEAQGEDEAVAHACEDHYKPKGPDDMVPADPVSIAVALADRFNILVGFWAINERPSGSKDPYALRRAELGIIRLILDNDLRFSFSRITSFAYDLYVSQQIKSLEDEITKIELGGANNVRQVLSKVVDLLSKHAPTARILVESKLGQLRPDLIVQTDDYALVIEIKRGVDRLVEFSNKFAKYWRAYGREVGATADRLTLAHIDDDYAIAVASFVEQRKQFNVDRLKVHLREQGARHDLVDAVFALEGQDDLLMIVRRIEALGKFLDTDDGKNLLAGVKRASNILRIEEKKDNKSYSGAPEASLLKEPEEKALHGAIATAKQDASAAVAQEDFAAAMTAMAKLRPFVDGFFDKVTVNADDKALRENRLKLLNEIRDATRAVADFSKIEG